MSVARRTGCSKLLISFSQSWHVASSKMIESPANANGMMCSLPRGQEVHPQKMHCPVRETVAQSGWTSCRVPFSRRRARPTVRAVGSRGDGHSGLPECTRYFLAVLHLLSQIDGNTCDGEAGGLDHLTGHAGQVESSRYFGAGLPLPLAEAPHLRHCNLPFAMLQFLCPIDARGGWRRLTLSGGDMATETPIKSRMSEGTGRLAQAGERVMAERKGFEPSIRVYPV